MMEGAVMDRELAQMVVNTASRAAKEMGNLMPLLKEHGSGTNDEVVRLAIAAAVYEIGLVRDRIFDQYPDLRSASEQRLEKYNRSYY
jgi:hypothetical protein